MSYAGRPAWGVNTLPNMRVPHNCLKNILHPKKYAKIYEYLQNIEIYWKGNMQGLNSVLHILVQSKQYNSTHYSSSKAPSIVMKCYFLRLEKLVLIYSLDYYVNNVTFSYWENIYNLHTYILQVKVSGRVFKNLYLE